MRITTRLLVLHFVLLGVVIGAVVWQSDRVITSRLYGQLNTDLSAEPDEVLAAASARPPNQSVADFAETYLQNRSSHHTYLLWLNPPEEPGTRPSPVLAARGSSFLASTAVVRSLIARPPSAAGFVTVGVAGHQVRVFRAPLTLNGRPVGTIVSAARLDSILSDRNRQLALVVIEGLAALVAAEVAAFFLLRGVLRTIRKVTDAAEAARTGDLAQRLPYHGPDDHVGRLVRTVDSMLGQLDAAFSAQRRLLADVSHQLRTPLTIARGHLEILSRESGSDNGTTADAIVVVLDELTQLTLMVERLLLLGQSLEPDFLHERAVHLPALVDEVFDAAKVMADRDWSIGPIPDVTVTCDAAKLRGALLNLLDNAVRATDEAGSISLRVDESDDGELALRVVDTGRGIAPDDQSVVFDRFRRSSTSAYHGNGLGLAIVKAVAESHGGRVELTSRPGIGSTFSIIIPSRRVSRSGPPVRVPAPTR